MFTYDVISESIRNPQALASELTRRSALGWDLVQITTDDTWVHALCVALAALLLPYKLLP
jgi:hypothetical protein